MVQGKNETEGLSLITKSDGKKYSVRHDRRRYFFPQEYKNFINQVKNKQHKFFYITCVHTGGRIMEVLNLQHKDIDTERGTITFRIVKQRKAKKNYAATGKSRSFFVGSEFLKEYKSYTRGKTINPEHYIFLTNEKLPENYSNLPNHERKKHYASKVVSYSVMLKKYCEKAGIPDYKQFSPDNLRKTFGMWTRTFDIDILELTYRMGHDIGTHFTHYSSPLIFTEEEETQIKNILRGSSS